MHIAVHPTLPYFAVQTADRLVEIFKILDEDERKRKLNRRRKRMNEKKSTGSGKAHGEDGAEPTLALADEFPSLRIIRASAKVRSFDFAPASAVTGSKDAFQLLVTLMNNSMEVYAVPVAKDAEATLVCALDRQGHRSDIRTMALSSDDEMLLSAGNGAIKVWNLKTEQCMRTLPAAASSFAVCCTFVPGNRYILVGTKTGDLEIYDTWSSTLIETVRAHDGCMWSIDVRPDKKGFVTGGADKEVKFWDFAAVEDVEVSTTSRRLTVLHMRTLRMSDEVLAVKYSPNQNLIAVSLLDSTVKVFFHDTLKFFLSLYGHKVGGVAGG